VQGGLHKKTTCPLPVEDAWFCLIKDVIPIEKLDIHVLLSGKNRFLTG